jgi:carboxyl-terminal processing protease
MKKKILALLLILLFILNIPSFAQTSQNNKKELLRHIYLEAKQNAKEKIDDIDLFLDALMEFAGEDDKDYDKVLANLTRSIDEYGDYITNEDLKMLNADLTGVSGGIGAVVEIRNGKLTVANVLPGSPSEKAGVLVGYAILSADDVDLTGMTMNKALSYVRGEIGTTVKITFETGMDKTVTLSIVRDKIDILSVSHKILDENKDIGYISISNFSETTGEELSMAIKELNENKIRKVILDLRYNGGGTLNGALQVCDVFLEKDKTIVTIEPRDVAESQIYKAGGQEYSGELVVLVNEYSASASEVVTGALKDHKRATIIGKTTFGKGTVQTLYNLPLYGGVYKYTTAYYKTPNGTSINKIGIHPNLTVENVSYQMLESEIPHFSFERKMQIDDQGNDVLELKKSLRLLNYKLNDTDIFDFDTYNAIKNFQANEELFSYGVCDFTTQSKLKQKLLDTKFYKDTQLDKAIEYLK